jgi:hypothetical protein
MRRDAKAGYSNTIVVHKWDRFARNRWRAQRRKISLGARNMACNLSSDFEQKAED